MLLNENSSIHNKIFLVMARTDKFPAKYSLNDPSFIEGLLTLLSMLLYSI